MTVIIIILLFSQPVCVEWPYTKITQKEYTQSETGDSLEISLPSSVFRPLILRGGGGGG